MEYHTLWCIKCGKQGIPIYRNKGNLRENYHKKKMYCITCKTQTNHIECKNDEEIQKFKELFKEGIYLQEANKYEK